LRRNILSLSQEKPKIGGWLIIVGLGVIFSPLLIITSLFPLYFDIFTNGSWEALNDPQSEVYSPNWGILLISEIIINVGLCLTWFYAGYLFFTKKHTFPKWHIRLMVFTLFFIIADAYATNIVFPGEGIFDPETIKELFRQIAVTAIWVPYMCISKRVKATFIVGKEEPTLEG
jgi:hypothetical protein